MADRIILRGAQFHGRHGVSPEERAVGGRVIVDLELEYDLTQAGNTDNLADTINYSDVFKTVRAQVEDQNFQLLESLAQRIAQAVLARFPARAVTVNVRKQPPPIRGIVESAGVEIYASRPEPKAAPIPGARLQPKEKGAHGLIIVYTGDGKGKTTAAIGMAFRALGRGWRALMVQFGKGSWHYGELDTAERLAPDLQIIPMGKGFYKILDDHFTEEEHRAAARQALEFAESKMLSGEYDLLILDEVNGAVSAGLLDMEDVLRLLDQKPEQLSLVLTGRNAAPALIERADLVTEMREIKHPYQKGILAQKGIDY